MRIETIDQADNYSYNHSKAPSAPINNEEVILETPKYIQWSTHGGGIYYPEYQVQLLNKIPTGFYSIGYDQRQEKYFVRKMAHNTDNILELPMPETKDIVKDIISFWENGEKFTEYGLTYKRGVLMYGSPGCGKSHIIQLIVRHLIERESGVVFRIETPEDVQFYSNFMHSTFKVIESNRKIVTIIEDIDGLFNAGKATETLLLNILDGMNQMDNIVYVATTNFPEELGERIINRPSRFDKRYEISLPNAEVRKFYFENTLKPNDIASINLDEWVKQTENMSIAHLRELVVSTVIQGNSFEHVIKTLKDLNEVRPNSKKFGGKSVGFGFGNR